MRLLHATVLFAAVACLSPAAQAQREKFSYDDLVYLEKTWPNAQKTNTGIRYVIQKPGQGQPPKPGDMVHVLYVGTLLDGTPFDKNEDRDHPFTFRLGRGIVIQGWDQVIQLMKPGEKRLVIIPPELAYGSQGDAPKVPRDASLVFTIELLGVDPEQ
ncbi:MAG: FKBP-type peptidyl-prolyl cis-trans isomerase [Opitutaceae bacterium]|jgi:FKBP-type peptidyl-prolyl cis-trans isomerase